MSGPGVGVGVGLPVAVGVGLPVAVGLTVAVGVGLPVAVGVGLPVAVGVGLTVAVGDPEGVGVVPGGGVITMTVKGPKSTESVPSETVTVISIVVMGLGKLGTMKVF